LEGLLKSGWLSGRDQFLGNMNLLGENVGYSQQKQNFTPFIDEDELELYLRLSLCCSPSRLQNPTNQLIVKGK
jgi:hypothetical protein